jgi:hypothetical protein
VSESEQHKTYMPVKSTVCFHPMLENNRATVLHEQSLTPVFK